MTLISLLLTVVMSLALLWPHSLLCGIETEVKSISVVIVRDGFEHTEDTYRLNEGEPMFDQIMSIIDRYSYHYSLNTIIKSVKNSVSLKGNDAGYWLNIYLYTEPNCYGDCYQIISGGTGEVIVDDGVYRIGYISNKKQLEFMSNICNIVQ